MADGLTLDLCAIERDLVLWLQDGLTQSEQSHFASANQLKVGRWRMKAKKNS
jgi:hypothetical protein